MSEFEHQGRTDHLESVLQAIAEANQTGILHVERGKGGVRDGGDIVILHGQVIEANTNTRQGVDALDWLLTWGNCQYNFQVKFPNELITTPPAPSSVPGVSLPATPVPPPPAVSPTTAPLNRSADLVTQNFVQQNSMGNGMERNVSQINTGGFAPLSGNLAPIMQEQEAPGNSRYQQQAAGPFSPYPIVRAPVRMLQGPEALNLLDRFRFSRLHRHIFLLLDGKRTAHDLVRLTGRPLDDVERLLLDLERAGLIRQDRN